MTAVRALQRVVILGAVAVAACATPAPPPPPLPPPPLPPPPPPVVVLPPVIPQGLPPGPEQARLEGLADRFLSFAAETVRAALPSSLTNAGQVIDSVDRSVTYLGPELAEGARATAVLAASVSPEFRAGIDRIGTPMGRDAFIARLKADPSFAATIPGADSARRQADGVLTAAFRQIEMSASTLHRQSYDLQRQRWTQVPVDKQARLAAVAARWGQPWTAEGRSVPAAIGSVPAALLEELSLPAPVLAPPPPPPPPTAAPVARAGTAARSGTAPRGAPRPPPAPPAPPPPPPPPVRAQTSDSLLAAAALLAVRDDAGAAGIVAGSTAATCTRRGYLNLRQCLAAGRFPYEQTFCLSVHSYAEQLGCLSDATR